MSLVNASIERWKNSLLDISKRNRAINYKQFKASTVEVSSPNLVDFLNTIENKPLKFVSLFNGNDIVDNIEYVKSSGKRFIKKDEYSNAEINEIINNYNLNNFKETNVFTPYSEQNLQTKLRHIANQARLFEEENALNVLYVGVGIFEWYESLTSAQKYRSPLLFIPVSLSQKTISDDFVLSLRENDLMLNDSLVRLMKEEFKVDLEFRFDTNNSLSDNYLLYKKSLYEIVQKNPGWAIIDELNISVFKFSTINMVKDIEENIKDISSHNLIKQLAGEKVKTSKINLSEINVDLKKPEDYFQSLESDSSQMVAIEAAISGESFVLQGPPGTGKSQTITNIITELISRGKKVLFVAEKKAALDVVYHNLKKIELSDYAISLHNLELDKSQTIAELANSLKERQGRYKKLTAATKEVIFNQYKQSKTFLNEYGKTLLEVRKPLNLSLYNLYGAYYSLDKFLDLKFKINQVEKIDQSYLNQLEIILKRLENILNNLGSLKDNPWYGVKINDDYQTLETLDDNLENLEKAFEELSSTIASLNKIFSKDLRKFTLKELTSFNDLLSSFESIKKPDSKIEGLYLDNNNLNHDLVNYELLLKARLVNDEVITTLNNYNLAVINLELNNYLEIVLKNSNFIRRLFSNQYRKVKKTILSYQNKPGVKYYKLLNDLQLLSEYQKNNTNNELIIKQITNQEYVDLNNQDLEKVITKLRNYLNFINLYQSIFKDMKIVETLNNLRTAKGVNKLEKILLNFNKTVLIFNKYFNYFKQLDNKKISEVENLVLELINSKQSLKAMINYNKLISEVKDIQVLEFIDLVIAENIKSHLFEIYLKRFYFILINYYKSKDSIISSFDKTTYDEIRRKFAESDSKLKISSSIRVRELINERTPNLASLEQSNYEVQTLLRESAKKRRIMPIRELFKEIPNLIMNLKPCLMMSPLSVSTYLRSSDYLFDVVIFDEASQVHPENAIGALYRSKQFIIVGDSKQLPPTNFFRTVEADDLEDETDVSSFESILDIAGTTLKQISLKWHYRSKFEELIRPSNLELYGNLITFPTTRQANKREGIDFEKVDGIYENQVNVKEAERVIALIYEHFDKFGSERSLGVVTFNKKQTRLIESELLKVRRKKPKYEQYFSYDLDEPFFIKNLENVQGDERDTIIISVTYGPNSKGRILMNFGPINNIGGNRRLNVAITRAKLNLIIVSSISYRDIDLSRVSNDGPKFLKNILKYAETGFDNVKDVISISNQNTDLFSFEVLSEIEKLGYQGKINIGSSHYKIDIGVIDPNNSNNYLLGIELDGNSYLKSETTRERDRLRQEVLEGRGWQIYRIWSTNWFNNKEDEVKKLSKVIKDILNIEIKNKKVENIIIETDIVLKTENSEFNLYPSYQTLKSLTASLPIYEQIEIILRQTTPIHLEEINKILPTIYGVKKYTNDLTDRFKEDLRTFGFYNDYEIVFGFVCKIGQEIKFRRVDDYKESRDFINIHDLELQDGIYQIIKRVKRIAEDELYNVIKDLSGYKSANVLMRNKIYQMLRKMINNELLIKEDKILKLRGEEK